jgi:TM2 domain-containing membrane protein YozV
MPVKQKNKWIAAALAVFLAGWGAHKFYLVHWKLGVLNIAIMLISATITAGLIENAPLAVGVHVIWVASWMLEGAIYAFKRPQDFHRIYMEGGRAMF